GLMLCNPYVTVSIDLERIRANLRQIAVRTKVAVLGVIKADAYGLGARRIAEAVADEVAGFCVFHLQEAVDAEIYSKTGKPTLALGPPASMDPQDFVRRNVTPSVSTV